MGIIRAVCKLRSTGPYSQSKHFEPDKQPNETDHDHELRRWRDRMHVDKDGYVYIPPTCFTKSIAEAAKYLSLKIGGRGNATYTKHFEAGVRVVEPLRLKIKAKDVTAESCFVPSNGQRGGSSRVTKFFPLIPEWAGTVTYIISDPIITQEVFCKVLAASGTLIGVGRFRMIQLGYYGSFEAEEVKWISSE